VAEDGQEQGRDNVDVGVQLWVHLRAPAGGAAVRVALLGPVDAPAGWAGGSCVVSELHAELEEGEQAVRWVGGAGRSAHVAGGSCVGGHLAGWCARARLCAGGGAP
jgi:hypothetical protein